MKQFTFTVGALEVLPTHLENFKEDVLQFAQAKAKEYRLGALSETDEELDNIIEQSVNAMLDELNPPEADFVLKIGEQQIVVADHQDMECYGKLHRFLDENKMQDTFKMLFRDPTGKFLYGMNVLSKVDNLFVEELKENTNGTIVPNGRVLTYDGRTWPLENDSFVDNHISPSLYTIGDSNACLGNTMEIHELHNAYSIRIGRNTKVTQGE